VNAELESGEVWSKPEYAQNLGRERARLVDVIEPIDKSDRGLNDALELLELAELEGDAKTIAEVEADIARYERMAADMEFKRMFSGELDTNNAYLDVQAGSGGTEAQDWAEMLLRMYTRWAEGKGFKVELLERSDGEVAGIKGATIAVEGPYAYGWLRTETGVHRLVRKSPFDSGNRRHTSFAGVYVSPEVDDNVEIEINPADLKVDTFRSSGAGGQHVNKTESAIRITHEPSGIVVACQTERSQHANRDRAMKMLRARLYEQEMQKRNAAKQKLEDSKADIEWGSQIRSYVLDQSRIKDLRTGVEIADTQKVLDGYLDPYIEASLKQGL
jgi:peptide chain release factor 2